MYGVQCVWRRPSCTFLMLMLMHCLWLDWWCTVLWWWWLTVAYYPMLSNWYCQLLYHCTDRLFNEVIDWWGSFVVSSCKTSKRRCWWLCLVVVVVRTNNNVRLWDFRLELLNVCSRRSFKNTKVFGDRRHLIFRLLLSFCSSWSSQRGQIGNFLSETMTIYFLL